MASPSSSQDSLELSDGIGKERVEAFRAALEDAIGQFHRGEEDGPYAFRGEFTQAESEQLDARCETTWRLGYDKTTSHILLYGDSTLPHQATIATLREAVRSGTEMFCGQLGAATADTRFNRSSPSERVTRILDFRGGETRNLGGRMKQADELVTLKGVDRRRIALAVEVAFNNESGGRAAEEMLDWVVNGEAEFSLAVKAATSFHFLVDGPLPIVDNFGQIKKDPDNQNDPFITVFFCDSTEWKEYSTGTPSCPVLTRRRVIHEWPCGSGSAIASQDMNSGLYDDFNIHTATSPLSSNPALVRYRDDFDAEVVFHGGEGDPSNILLIHLGRSWAAQPRPPSGRMKFSDHDWLKMQGLKVNLDLGMLREEIIMHCHEASHSSST